MPIGEKGSTYFKRLHVADKDKGFHPYVVAVKDSGTYIEGAFGHLLHISLHHDAKARRKEFSQCHLTVPNEIEHKITRHGFSDKQYFKWFRKSGETKQFNCALKLIFPVIFADIKDRAIDPVPPNTINIPLTGMATIIDIWYTRAAPAELDAYLRSFSSPQYVSALKNGECIGISVSVDTSRDYSAYQALDNNFGTYHLTGENGVIDTSGQSIFIGLHGEHCRGVLHGKPKRLPNPQCA